MAPEAAGRLWAAAEPVHALVYFDRSVRRAVRAAGAPGFWSGYLGTRLAPLRTADPGLATSALYVFAPAMVAEHLPAPAEGARWDGARRAAVRDVLAGLGGDAAAPPAEVWTAAGTRVRQLVESCDAGARPLFAAHASLPWPDDPWLGLWHGVTLLREHRGDGHLHVLAGERLSGCEAMVLALRWRGHGDGTDAVVSADRGWSADEVAAAYAALEKRGWAGADRELTPAGREARAAIERDTDARSLPRGTGESAIDDVVSALAPLAALAVPHIPRLNPIGVAGAKDA